MLDNIIDPFLLSVLKHLDFDRIVSSYPFCIGLHNASVSFDLFHFDANHKMESAIPSLS